MKILTEHLSKVLLAIVAIALIASIVLCFTTPIGQVFGNILTKINEQAMGDIWGYGAYEPGGNGGGENSNPEVMTRLEGDGQEFYTLAPTPLSFRSTAPMSELQEVQINGVTVDPSNYTVTEGSTVVTFPIEYLKTLEADDYEVTVVSESMSPKGDFTVVAPELNEYGFYYNQPYTAYVDAFGGTTVFFMREGGTMDVLVTDNGYAEVCSYTVNGNNLTINAAAGTFTGISNNNGIYCNELATTFVLGDESIVADEDYLYMLSNTGDAYYVASIINKTKSSYGTIRTGINDKPTSYIGEGAFAFCTNLTSITIPECIEYVLDGAFYGCTSLNEVVFENCDVALLGNDIFSDAPLTSGIIYNHVGELETVYQVKNDTEHDHNLRCTVCRRNARSETEACEFDDNDICVFCDNGAPGLYYYSNGSMIFSRWDYLIDSGKIQITDGSITGIYFALAGRLIIPDSVTSITLNSVVTPCVALESIEIPASVVNIDKNSFKGWTSLTSITVDENNAIYKSIDGNLYTKDGKTLIKYAPGKTDTTFTIPDGVETVGIQAFYNCTSLTSIVIPDSVETVGTQAFYNCSNLATVTFGENSRLRDIGTSAFYNCTSLKSIEIPASIMNIYPYAFDCCRSLESVVFPASLGAINLAFQNCTSLENITFKGTMEQWNAITKSGGWNTDVPATEVICSDGTVTLN